MMINNIKRLSRSIRNSISSIKVDFLIAGTQKGGTSALDTYLRAHPEVCMAKRKEVHFFDKNRNFYLPVIGYPIYHSYFDPGSENRLIGESTPTYMYWADAPRHIWQYNPEMKIIIVLRNPIERAFSHWNMERDRKRDSLSFWDAIQTERERCRQALPNQNYVFSYVDRGYYTEQIRRIWRYFPQKQTLILKNEHLRNNPSETLEKVACFLGIESFREVEAKEIHSRAYVSTLQSREKKYLIDLFEYDIRSLERMLGWDCSNWLD